VILPKSQQITGGCGPAEPRAPTINQRSTRKGYAASVRRQSRQRLRSVYDGKRRSNAAIRSFHEQPQADRGNGVSEVCQIPRAPAANQRSTRKGYAASVRRQSRRRLRSVCGGKRRSNAAIRSFREQPQADRGNGVSEVCQIPRAPIINQRSVY